MGTIFERVAKEAGGDRLASKSELAELRRIQAEWQAASDTAAGCGVDSAYTAFLGQGKRVSGAVRGGKVHEHLTLSREEIEADHLRKGDSARGVMRELCKDAAKVARPIAERFAELAHQVAARIEKSEAELFASWGVAYTPSALVLELRRLPDLARRRVPSSDYAASSPASMLPFLSLT